VPPLWTPSPERAGGSRLAAFGRRAGAARGLTFPAYADLHKWSIEAPEQFWTDVWSFCGVVGEPGEDAVADVERMPGATFFPGGRLNFAANLLKRRDDAPAIVATSEVGRDRTVSWNELHADVCRAASALRAAGVRRGDRVAAVVANTPETIIAALGAAAIGAVWSSCSPDFGEQGILDRFGQISPSVLFAVDGYVYGGKRVGCGEKIAAVTRALPGLRQIVTIPILGDGPSGQLSGAVGWNEWLARGASADEDWELLPFNHPLYILFSSGTTGVPKCIVHGAGGTLLQHLKEHQLHCDIGAGDRVFYYTTCGWMMWNWLVTCLASDATLVLFDGSPFQPDARRLFELAERTRITLFGVSAKYLDAVRKSGIEPKSVSDLSSLRTITSTGSPLSAESFDFVYGSIAPDVHLASISGGTDIVSCFVGGNPTAPVWRGEIQCAALGMDVDVFDETGAPARGEPGELVCKRPFPSMPVGFWNDAGGARYRASYFERFPGVWCHGDWIQETAHGGYVIYGRSDATLNPGGVRIGTAEIYRQVEQLPEVLESLAVGQKWDNDERIVLFVRLADGLSLDDSLRKRIADRIRTGTSARHVPARIVQVPDIPRTKSGKIVEIAVRNVIHNRSVTNREALANPEALDLFRDLPELQR
jgi:acetoacetyl-CoA synthetase